LLSPQQLAPSPSGKVADAGVVLEGERMLGRGRWDKKGWGYQKKGKQTVNVHRGNGQRIRAAGGTGERDKGSREERNWNVKIAGEGKERVLVDGSLPRLALIPGAAWRRVKRSDAW
jgi:hypothetical protein